ncbi:hypothetical protein BS47DRAFT_1354746 [Hydnum rufescens UP504]|uniref:CCL2-like lectin domain-containing protein n=1 Tax=Hydnum rufescens UP504 TaxID=1448309 RepID=A0A9P6AFJ8_9AGAM|nr:hypothetical protein BS47DRAFT_1354746 [Hydnum rufescens UP504]
MASVPHNIFVIINRVLSPNNERLAVEYKGLDKNLTLEPLDEGNDNQLWVIKSPNEPTTIVPLLAGDEQAAQNLQFVLAKKLEKPEEWELAGYNDPPPTESCSFPPDRVWDGGKAVPGAEVTIDTVPMEPRSFTQLWVLKGAILGEA